MCLIVCVCVCAYECAPIAQRGPAGSHQNQTEIFLPDCFVHTHTIYMRTCTHSRPYTSLWLCRSTSNALHYGLKYTLSYVVFYCDAYSIGGGYITIHASICLARCVCVHFIFYINSNEIYIYGFYYVRHTFLKISTL